MLVMPWYNRSLLCTSSRTGKIALSFMTFILVSYLLSPLSVLAVSGFGDYISEKLLGNGTNEVLYLGDGTNELVIIGSGPVVSTGSASSYSSGNVVVMTMEGNLQSLNGMPRADTWFRWGYAPGAMVFTTTPVTVSATGAQTATINPTAGLDVYYQFAASTDGTSYGSSAMLSTVGGAHGVSYWLLHNLLPAVLAMVIIVAALMLTHNLIVAFMAAVIGIIGFHIILALLSSF